MGYNYTHNPVLNSILQDPGNHCVILYPGAKSLNLTGMSEESKAAVFPHDKKLVVIVIDGTWGTAGKMLSRSRNLWDLPRICFTPSKPSNFRVRKQPKVECYSTLEAIHETIELLGPSQGFAVESRAHDALTYTFDKMVEQQLDFIKQSHSWRRRSRHYREKPATP